MTKFLCSRILGPLKLALLVACIASATCLGPIAVFVLGEYSRSVNRSASLGSAHISISLPSASDDLASKVVQIVHGLDGSASVSPVLRVRVTMSVRPFSAHPGDESLSGLSVDCLGLDDGQWTAPPFDYDNGRAFLPFALTPPLEMMARTDTPEAVLVPLSFVRKVIKKPSPNADGLIISGVLPDGTLLSEKTVVTGGVFEGGVFSSGNERTPEIMWHLAELRKFAKIQSGYNSVEVLLKNGSAADNVATVLRQKLPPGCSLQTWREREHAALALVYAIEMFVNLTLALFLGIGLLAVYTAMRMIFDDRLAEFGTLKALGCSSWNLLKILLRLGVVIGGTGALIGGTFGWLFASFARDHLFALMKISPSGGAYDILYGCIGYGLQTWIAAMVIILVAGWPVMRLQPATLLRDE